MLAWLRDTFGGSPAREAPAEEPPPASEWRVPRPTASSGSYVYRWHDGEKFYGGFGDTEILDLDYWTLRARSAQLFRTNLYARGLIRRFVTNVINTGLHLEAAPDPSVLGVDPDTLTEWSERVENRFELWRQSPRLSDHQERRTFGAKQAAAYAEALIAGDVLVNLRQDRRTGLPRVHLVSGEAIQTPLRATPRRGNRIEHGVELDPSGRHVAFWVRQLDSLGRPTLDSARIPAYGEKSGRLIAWLVYATDKRLDDVRIEPLLSLVLQSLRDVDRYRDSTQRKALIQSFIALYIAKGEDKPGTRPIAGGAIRRDTKTETSGDGKERTYRTADLIPGLVLDELQHGEEPKAFQTHGTVESFGDFEEAIIQGIAWANEVPPEILKLAFSNNYSASQAAINEFKMFLNRARGDWGESFCAPIYQDWLLSEVLEQRVGAPRLLEAWRDPRQYDVYAAWIASEWAGQIKPAVDLSKLVRGYREMVDEGFITRDRAARELTGMKYSKNVKQLAIENEQLADARRPLAEQEPDAAETAPDDERDEDVDDERDDEETDVDETDDDTEERAA